MKKLAAKCSLAIFAFAIGCGDARFGRVDGTVTLDNQPVANARITFEPLFPAGSPSYGETDDQGRYEVQYGTDQPGAMVGKHRVVISTYEIITNEDGSKTTLPENIPARYNEQTELEVEVIPGSQTIPFELVSQ